MGPFATIFRGGKWVPLPALKGGFAECVVQLAVAEMFKEPAMAISRNAVTISIGFTPLLLAPLVPYKTVGFFLAAIMAVSWLSTLLILPALLTLFRRYAFGRDDTSTPKAKGETK